MSVSKSIPGQRETPNSAEQLLFALPPIAHPARNTLDERQRALLNILEDFAAEKSELESGKRAVLNILDDFDAERAQMQGAQRAVLNILEDSFAEKMQFAASQRSMLNILDDFSEEKVRLQDTQRAALNILDDFETEKAKVQRTNEQLEVEIEERRTIEKKIQGINTNLLAANKELETFSSSVSNDLRTPLRAIGGFSHALLEDYSAGLDEGGKDYLNRIRSAAQRMGQLIDDLLNLSRITRTVMRLQKVDLSAVVSAISAELQSAQPERRVQFQIENGLTAIADPGLMQMVLMNLLSNAWKFTSKRPLATIQFGKIDLHPSTAYFVRDDGAGFDPDYAERLYGAFQRLHAATDFPGTGVGLATVQRIVHRHGGRIWAESKVDRGTTFFFTLDETQV